MLRVNLTIEGLQEAQDANARAIAALRPTGALGEAVRFITTGAHRYAVSITHVDTGALRAAHRMDVQEARGTIFIDRGAYNPRTRVRVEEYAADEEARGGSHAFYSRTISELGDHLLQQGVQKIMRALP